MEKYIPKVIERKEQPPITRVIGQFLCTGKGNEPPTFGSKPCGSLLELTIDNIYKTVRHFGMGSERDNEDCATFRCPVCDHETDFDLPSTVKMCDLVDKKEFELRNTEEFKEEPDDPIAEDWCGTSHIVDPDNPSGCLPREMVNPSPKKRKRLYLPRNVRRSLLRRAKYQPLTEEEKEALRQAFI